MKTLATLSFLCLLISCGASIDATDRPIQDATTPNSARANLDKASEPFVVGAFKLRTSTLERKCILLYMSEAEATWKEIETGMDAPCVFIGQKIKPQPPQKFDFWNGTERVTVVMISGGQAHPKFRDEYMPNGCGTELTRVRVYSDRVLVDYTASPPISATDDYLIPYCPSNPLDKVFFAT